MSIPINLALAYFFVAILISLQAGLYLAVRYRTRLARWAAVILLSQAFELTCYLLAWFNAAPILAQFIYLIQVLGFTVFLLSWLVFVFGLTRHSQWITPRNLALLAAPPAVYFLGMVVRWLQGPVAAPAPATVVGSLIFSPLAEGWPGASQTAYGFGLIAFSTLVLLQFFLKSPRPLRRTLLPLLAVPNLMALAAALELMGFNPFQPVSIHHLAIAANGLFSFVLVFDLRLGGVLASARETVMDQMKDGVLILDQQDRIVDVNPSARQILGPVPDPLLQRQVSALWPDLASLLTRPALSELRSTFRVNGLDLAFDINTTPLFDAYGESLGRVIVLRNVTGREQMERALTERTQQLSQTNALLGGLAEVTVQLQTVTEPSQLNAILGDELKRLGLVCFIARLEPESQELRMNYLSNPPEVIGRIERLLGLEIRGYRLDRQQFAPLYQLLASNEMSYKPFRPGDLAYGPGKLPAVLLEQIIRTSGLEPDMAALVLPLAARAHSLGLVGVWGPRLTEADIAPFRIFASQVAQVMERAGLYEAEIRRSAELARANSLVIALSKVASQVGTTTQSARVLDTLGQELRQLGLNCAVVSFDPAGETAFLKYLSFNPEVVRTIEKLTGLPVANRAVPRQLWPGATILEAHRPVWYADPIEIFRRMWPVIPRAVSNQAFQLLGFGSADQLCVLPLVSGERTIGALLIWGAGLKPDDSPALSVFANQVAGILQNAANYETEVQRKDELARSNAVILALSKVAARLDTTSDITQVYDTLGAELQQLRLSCLIGTLDEAQQSLKFEYLSVKAEVMGWLNGLGAFLPGEVIVPRRLWSTDKVVTEKTPYWDPTPVDTAARTFPFLPSQVVLKAFEMAGMEPDAPACYVPMIDEEAVIGILVVWGPDLRQGDLPGLSVFANQVATAMKNARLYDQAQREIVERTQAEARIQAALSEKELLLKEVHHRVKNNLQVISSMLSLQAAQVTDPQTAEALRESQTRVRSMALIHEKLYQSPDLARIEFADYLKRLVNSLAQTYRVKSNRVTLHVEADDVALNIDTAIPCGLIVNELVSNSLKYAFPAERSGSIAVGCRRSSAGKCILSVGDDGIGLPAGLDVAQSSSLGLKLVTSLVEQIDGELRVNSAPGAHFEIHFKAS